MWRPHDKGCKCDECKAAARREKTARIEAERRNIERSALDATRTWFATVKPSCMCNDCAGCAMDAALVRLTSFEKKHGGRP